MPEQYQKIDKSKYAFEFRACNLVTGRFLVWENNRDEILEILKGTTPGWSVSQWTGHFDESGKKIFAGDIVDIDVMNEFGSLLPEKGIVIYNLECACYSIKTRSFPFEQSHVTGVKVITDMYVNRKYANELLDYVNVSPALIGL